MLVVLAVLVVGFGWAFAAPASGAAGTVALFDDDSGTALFTAADRLAPGRPVAQCISVGADFARAGDAVTFAATGVGGPLADHLTLTLESGTGGRFGDCTGFTGTTLWNGTLTALAAASVGDGLPTGWQPDVEPLRTFRVTVVVDPALTVQGLSAQGVLSWQLLRAGGPGPTPTPTTPTTPAPPTPSPTGTTTPTTRPTTPPTSSPTSRPTATPTTPATPAPSTATDRPVPTGPPDFTWPTSGGDGGGPSGGPAPAGEPDVRIGGAAAATLDLLDRAARAALAVVMQPQYPLLTILAALLFLLVQDRIDRRDPKLATASVSRRDADLVFPDVLVTQRGARP